MENAVPCKQKCLIFDLKGSTVGRFVPGICSEDPPLGMVLKDLNFKLYGERIFIENREKIEKDLLDDMRLLRNNRLMDYSMIMGIYKDSDIQTRYSLGGGYSIAIIDFFQRYGFRKSAERIWKRYILRKNKGISVVSETKYYQRIKKYIRKIVSDPFVPAT